MDLDKQKAPDNKVIEIKDLDQLLSLIKTTPAVVVDFWATWAPACAPFRPIFTAKAESDTNVLFCSVNVDSAEETAAHFCLKEIPQVTFFLN